MSDWVTGNVTRVIHWTERLFSLILRAPINPFIAGQFARIRLEINGKKVQRAYSYVNAPSNTNLEFYILTVPQGKLSATLCQLQPGENVLITKDAYGIFVLDKIPSCDNLWMISTGTAIGPYLSILEEADGLEKFSNIILVPAVRCIQDLNYYQKILTLKKRYQGKLRVQTILSREQLPDSLTGHIPTLIADGSLEASVNIPLEAQNNHVMLCGNPQMVRDTQKLLIETRSMKINLKSQSGNITSEHYW